MPFDHRAHSHTPTPTQTDNARQFTYQAHLWDAGGTEVPKENPRRRGENCKLHRDSGPAGNRFFPYQCYNKIMNETTFSRTSCTIKGEIYLPGCALIGDSSIAQMSCFLWWLLSLTKCAGSGVHISLWPSLAS